MVNYYIYAKDFSGSTGFIKHYHNNGIKSFHQFKNDVDRIEKQLLVAGEPPTESKIIYLHWGDQCYEVDEEITTISYNELQCGNMGTQPESIIRWIQNNYNICGKNNKIKLLYIITDGLIGFCSMQKCFDLNEHMHYETVVFHAFNEDLRSIDLSVATSFLKCRCIIYRNYELFENVDISEEFDYDKINTDNFEAERENLKSYIKLKFINNFKHDARALHEIDRLKKLRNRLFVELTSKLKKRVNILNTMDRDVFLREFINTDWYKNLRAPGHDEKVQIEKSISTLINYIVSDTKSYSFDALKFDSKFDKPIEVEPIVDVNFTTEQEIEFPDIILFDDRGVPVILLTEFNLLDKIIFHTTKTSDVNAAVSPASFNKFKSAMECPLFLLKDPDISESVGYFYTLKAYKELLKNSSKTEPRTRRPFHGGLVLTDTDHFDKYNDYILSATYFAFKKINYNIGLFYYVLWKNCQNKEWMDKNVVEQFKKYVMRRISASVCKIGLSSLPLDPQLNTTLPTALWYCVELSSCIFKDDPQHFMQERLRMYYGVAHCMIEILQYFKYDLCLDTIKNRRDVIRHVMTLKKIPTRREKVYYLLERIFKNVNGFLVSEIEKPFNLNKLNYLKFDHKDMLCDDVIEEKVYLNEYVHLMHIEDDLSNSRDGKDVIKICLKTFRPFFTIDENKSFYTELVKITKKAVINNDGEKDKIKITFDAIDSLDFDQILSVYNLFINCVKDCKKYPSLNEYIEYISKKKKFNEDLVTIFPSNLFTRAEKVYSLYQDIVTKVDISKFIEVSKKHVKRSDRIKAEQIVEFNNEDEINEYISKEELKVNLIKKPLIAKIKPPPILKPVKTQARASRTRNRTRKRRVPSNRKIPDIQTKRKRESK